ncbi:FtsX-like permease family protein [Actinosynnema sp. NPDC023587]|uniref:FtsX-like permease family protein n=1 Tax=Actinosynnema sp. NPDC023587 TaxID=3154695 RepID=UPI003403DCE3
MSVRGLAWQLVKARKLAFIGAFIAILCGSAVVAACGMLLESGIRSGVPTERYAAASVVVGGEQSIRPEGVSAMESQQVGTLPTVSGDLIRKIEAVPGVDEVVGETTFEARAVTADGPVAVLGHNWDSAVLTPYELRDGRQPGSPREVVVDASLARRAGLAVGGRLDVMTTSTPVGYEVVGIAAPSGKDGLAKQTGLYFTSEQAARLADAEGRYRAIGVFGGGDAADLAERVEEALRGDHVMVAAGDDRGTVEFAAVGQSRMMLMAISGSFGGIALLVAGFVVAGTLTLAMDQRRRELALLRAIAATPRQIAKLIGSETVLVAGVAAALGAGAGIFVGHGLRDAFVRIGVMPADFALSVGPIPLVVAFLLGLGVARLSAAVAARRPSRIAPTEALGEAAVERRDVGVVRTVIGLVLLLGGAGLATVPLFVHTEVAMAMSASSVLLAVIGVALLGPRAVTPIMWLVTAPLSKLGVTGYLAAANNRANTRRLASALTPLMLSIAFAVVNFFSQSIATAAGVQESEQVMKADYAVTAPGGVSPEVAEAARRIDGVAAAGSMVRTRVTVLTERDDQERTLVAEGKPALGLDRVGDTVDLAVTSGSLDDLRGNAVAVSGSEASSQEVGLGGDLTLYLDDGQETTLKVVAIYDRELAYGGYVLPAELARAHSPTGLDDSTLVKLSPGADHEAVRARLAALGAEYPGLTAVGKAELGPAERGERYIQFWVNLVAVGVILGYIAISVANTLVLSTAQRRREFALLRLVGGTRRQVVRMMRAEAATVVGIAIVVGTLIAGLPLVMLSIGFLGTPVPSGPILVYLGIIGFAALLGFLALGVPTRLALRAKPVDAIGMRE